MTTLSKIKILLLLALYGLSFSIAFSQSNSYKPNELLVKWKSPTNSLQRSNLKTVLKVKNSKVKHFKNLGIEVWTLAANANLDILELVKKYQNHPGIEYIEPNYIFSINETIPNDPQFASLWGLKNTGQYDGTLTATINATEAWAIKKESPSVKVAIIDTGIDWTHPDLVNNIWQNLGEDADGDGRVIEWNGSQWIFDPDDENGRDDDGNGYVDDFVGWDFVNNDNNPFDDSASGHGTHVAGTIGAEGNNGIGVAGVTWRVQMAALKALDDTIGYTSSIVEALNYAVKMEMPISNASLGGFDYSEILYDVIQKAANQNHLLIAAAGNMQLNNDKIPTYPASYDLDNIIAVAASNNQDKLATDFSNFGITTVDLAAPGTNILSCHPNNLYRTYSGTSMAVPHVTGACALLLELYPSKTYKELKNDVLNSVDVLPALEGITITGGRLNLCKLLGGCAEEPLCISIDRPALVALYNATDGANWTNKWDLNQPIHTWYGIDTNQDGCVTGIQLADNNLIGSIPPETGHLVNLKELQLSQNQLTGSIPVEIGQLHNLQNLYLSQNQLTGNIPTEIENLLNLSTLALYNNQLIGNIPTEIGRLSHLQSLLLYNNKLTGNIPITIEALTNLQQLRLENNQLTGAIPTKIEHLTNLLQLDFSNNQLIGILPDLQKLDKLELLHLENNQLTGCFPSAFAMLCNIDYDFSNNPDLANGGDFTVFCTEESGVCPPCRVTDSLALIALYKATNGPEWKNTWNLSSPINTWYGVSASQDGCVIYLVLQGNNLTGTIPPEIGDFTRMRYLSLYNNNLTGSIPSSIGNLINLEQIQLSDNNLTGAIPSEIGNLTSLRGISIANNELTDSIPPEIGNLTGLTGLSLGNNHLTGSIPSEIGQLTNLQGLFLYDNELTGIIPPEIGQLTNLTVLRIYRNKLSGSIPSEIKNLKNLTELQFSYNQLTGSIPIGIGQLTKLKTLGITSNKLTGNIPPEIGQLTNLTSFGCSVNALTGIIPPDLGKLTKLTSLGCYQNQLTGIIPPEIGNLRNLERLHLADNNLTGSIPLEIGNLTKLTNIQLYGNQLSGCFPQNLRSLCDITYNFTYNRGLPSFPEFCANGTGMCIDLIWPGDFNRDGEVNTGDLLFYDLAKGFTGPVRPSANTNWTAQVSLDWGKTINGINVKYCDADGNGIINEQDFQVSLDNSGKTHP